MKDLLQRRLHGRAAFGARPEDASRSSQHEPDAWLEDALQAAPANPPRSDPFADLGAGIDFARRELPFDRDMRMEIKRRSRETARAVSGARLQRAVRGLDPLREVMIDFWANHFAVDARTTFVGGLLPHYEHAVLEPHALGRFEDLLLAVARSPAMLVYLDNWRSTAPHERLSRARARTRKRDRGGINENYARELLELHTLGVDAGYTQQDIVEVARILTGWGISRRDGGRFRFGERLHDSGSKLVLGERYPEDGIHEGELLLRKLARHPSTARHVSRKLVRIRRGPATAGTRRTNPATLPRNRGRHR
jgi:uncharacterized protein (DUF1800 family)